MAECSTCCTSCDTCQLCDTGCQEGCDTCQGFCESNQTNDVGAFSFSACVVKDEIICPDACFETDYFNRKVWNEAVTRINEIYARGNTGEAGKGDTSPMTAVASQIKDSAENYITADDFIRIANAAGHTPDAGVAQDKVIYGSYFTSLEAAIGSMKFKSNQCDTCNSSCNIECDVCQSCDAACNGCDSECDCTDCCDCSEEAEEEEDNP